MILHTSVENNCCTDLLSRWGNQKSSQSESSFGAEQNIRLERLFHASLEPEFDSYFTWPNLHDIMES